jgi:hypothetical protein
VKKAIGLVMLVVLVVLLVDRQKAYVRDPLAKLYRNDVKQAGVQVYINYSNDVLIENDDGPAIYRRLVQNWNRVPGTPVHMLCIHFFICMADDEHVVAYPVRWEGQGHYDPQVSMTNREVSFVDGDGAVMRVTLR